MGHIYGGCQVVARQACQVFCVLAPQGGIEGDKGNRLVRQVQPTHLLKSSLVPLIPQHLCLEV